MKKCLSPFLSVLEICLLCNMCVATAHFCKISWEFSFLYFHCTTRGDRHLNIYIYIYIDLQSWIIWSKTFIATQSSSLPIEHFNSRWNLQFIILLYYIYIYIYIYFEWNAIRMSAPDGREKVVLEVASRNSKLPLFYTIRVQKEKRKTKSSSSSVFAPSIKREINFTQRNRVLTAKKCTKKCNARAKLLFWRPRCRRRNMERRCFVSNGNAYELVLGRLLNFLKIWCYISTLQSTYKKRPRVLTYLDFCPKVGAHSRRCYERTRMI